ncbi:hypothetical protein [Owenweeksia hongkongensis]|uniref:hypothetical protein n=1 Tax=Owenweeksia hongkongensis TaxID=253245 RepID=UPI003A94844A
MPVAKTYSHVRIALFGLLFILLANEVQGQFFYGTRQTFGKNRVQYTEFDWVFYRFERFDVYFYRGNKDLAAQVARMADKQLPRIEALLDAPLDDRVQILVFNNLSDLKQSNVNSSSEEDYNTTGVTRISGRRLFLHFDGDYVKLEGELRSGLSEVVLSNLIYGSFTQSIKNSTLLNLPEWYTEGLISYIGNPDNPNVDKHVRDGYLSGQYKSINSVYGEQARYAGHSIWNYLADTYGQKVLKNVVYMAVVNRNIESGFLYILGKDLDEVLRGWQNYLKEQYEPKTGVENFAEEELLKVKKHHIVTHISTSNDGRYLAYTSQRFSRYKVFLYDFEKDKKKRLLTEGYRIAQNSDYSYPLLAWHPNGEILAMITEEQGFVYLHYYELEKKKWQKQKFFKFDKILSFEYSADGKRFVLSAVKDGQSDIFIYTILNTKVEQLTNDTYADLYPTWIEKDSRIAFSSNRPTDSVKLKEKATEFPKRKMDIYAMSAREPKDTSVIWQLTNSPFTNEIYPKSYADGYVSILSQGARGVASRHLLKIDSSIASVDTTTHYAYEFSEYKLSDYNRSILAHEVMQERDEVLEMALVDKRYRIYSTPYRSPEDLNFVPSKSSPVIPVANPKETERPDRAAIQESESMPLYYPGVDPTKFEVDINDYKFDNVDEKKDRSAPRSRLKPKEVDILPAPIALEQEPKEEEPLDIPPQRNYFLSFFQKDFTVGFDNIYDNPQYQPFTGFVSGDYLNSGFNMTLGGGVQDLMHDYTISAMLSTSFQPLNGTSIIPNSEIMVVLSDYKNRFDKDYVFARRSKVQLFTETDYERTISNEATYKLSYPFNPVSSLRGSLGYRMDEIISLSRDDSSLDKPTKYQDYAIARLAYVYDNTRKIGPNLYSGLRYKIFTEYYRNLYKSPTGLHTAGIDLRNYTIIHKNLIWANRFAAGTSFGPEKLIYIMGGVDNMFVPKFEPTTPIAQDNNYIFQTLVTNMRGFYQNSRNGNSFAVFNSELRWPIFSYLFQKPIKSDFIKNLQVIGFGDVGTAWNGPSPYSKENAINTSTIPYGPTGGNGQIIIDSQKDPIIYSYGVGLRTRLFGYYLRFDWAWPVEDGIILDSEFAFSLGYDF